MKKIILLLTIMGSFLFSITLIPLYKTIDNKKKKYIIFEVSNPTSEPVAVTISVLHLISTDNNKEERVKSENISYYPSQLILNPKEKKAIRMRYMGKNYLILRRYIE